MAGAGLRLPSRVTPSARPTNARPAWDAVVSVSDCTISKRRIGPHLPGATLTPCRIVDSRVASAAYRNLRGFDSRKQEGVTEPRHRILIAK